MLFDGGEFGTGGEIGSDDELDFLGIPGLLDAEQVGTLLRQRQHEQQSRKKRQSPQRQRPPAPAVPDHRMLMDLRNELAKNVAAWSARTGTPHGVVHTKLRDSLRRPGRGPGQRGAAAGPPAEASGLVHRPEVAGSNQQEHAGAPRLRRPCLCLLASVAFDVDAGGFHFVEASSRSSAIPAVSQRSP